jgi:hypothetical protein
MRIKRLQLAPNSSVQSTLVPFWRRAPHLSFAG